MKLTYDPQETRLLHQYRVGYYNFHSRLLPQIDFQSWSIRIINSEQTTMLVRNEKVIGQMNTTSAR